VVIQLGYAIELVLRLRLAGCIFCKRGHGQSMNPQLASVAPLRPAIGTEPGATLLVATREVMALPPGTLIEPVGELVCAQFFQYLRDHCSDNGKGETGYFLPSSQTEAGFPPEKEQRFRDGLKLPVASPGWRRAWLARDGSGQVLGHVDLRSHATRFTEHRSLLGIGVHRNHRRLGLGAALLSHTSEWASAHGGLEWLDLEVLSANERAIRLYLRAGFSKVGEVPDMFRIDGHSFAWITMTKRLREQRGG
jgi:YD repeat-containing protein